MRKVKIGDTVTATLFGGQRVTGKVEDIQICAQGEKSGRSVKTCDLDKHRNGVIDLDCGHWCYFYQVIHINIVDSHYIPEGQSEPFEIEFIDSWL